MQLSMLLESALLQLHLSFPLTLPLGHLSLSPFFLLKKDMDLS